MNRDANARHQARAWALLLIAGGIAWFAVLGQRPLFNPDEGRYAEIPAEMLASGDFTLPRLDGVVYLEKPPLQYWASALMLAAFGHTEFAARLYTAASAALTLLVVYALGRRLWDRERGLTAAAMTGSMLLFVFLGQLLTLDMALCLWLTIAIACFCCAQLERGRGPRQSRGWMLGCWAAMAAATLTKGLIGIAIPGAVLVLYTLLQRDYQCWRHLQLVPGLGLFALLTVPWGIAVERAHPGALDFLIVHEHFARYLSRVHDRWQPWWYFGEVLALGTLPWLPQMLRALCLGWRATRPPGQFDAARVLWVSAAFTLVFFSLSDSKLAPYVLPMLPPLALLGAGRGPSAALDLALAAGLQALLGLALAVAIPLYVQRPLAAEPAWMYTLLQPWLVAVAALLVLGGVAAYGLGRRSLAAGARALAASGFAAGLALLAGGADAIATRYTSHELLASAGPLTAGAPWYAVETFDWTLPFYTRAPLTPVAWRGELDYGLNFEPDRGIATVDEFARRWQALSSGYALLPHATHLRLKRANLPMRTLAQNFDSVLVSRQ